MKLCLSKCYEDDIYNLAGNECITECNSSEIIVYKNINDVIQRAKKCESNTESSGKYKYNNIYFGTCNDTEDFFKIKTFENSDECVEDCSLINGKTFVKDNKCSAGCDGVFYYNNICLENCNENDEGYNYKMNFSIINNNNEDSTLESIIPSDEDKNIITIQKDQYPKEKECLKNCPSGTYIDEDNKICYVSSCNNEKYINSNNLTCIEDCNFNIYEETSIIGIEETGQETTFYKITKKYCLSSCPVTYPYYNNNDRTCSVESCKDRNLYSAYDKPYICYTSCSDISGGEYNNEKDYICYKSSGEITCEKYYYKDENNVTKCSSRDDCITKGFYYIKGRECVKECNIDEYKIKREENSGEMGRCFSDPKECQNVDSNYIFIDEQRTCKKTCDDYKTSETKPISDENGINCFKTCPSNYPFKNLTSRLCLMYCNDYYNGDECVKDCSEKEKYHFEGNSKCLDECKIGNEYYYIKDISKKLCDYSCDGYFIKYREENTQGPYKCVDECQSNEYYYEDKKECIKDCALQKGKDSQICVHQCSPNEVVKEDENGKFYCHSSCDDEGKQYILNTELVETNPLKVDKCITEQECKDKSYFISISDNRCLENCSFSGSYEYDGKCYAECPTNTFPNDIENKCINESDQTCNEPFKYYDLDEKGNFRCKKSCYPDKYALPEGGKCLENCPPEYNFIYTYNKLCLKNCSGYGDYYKTITIGETEIISCLSSCGENDLILPNNTCINDIICPDGLFKVDNKCIQSCNPNDPNKPFTTIDENGKKICATKCNEAQPNYGEDKICKVGCEDETVNKIIDWDKKCVPNCTNKYYIYLEEGKCVNQCSESNFYFNNECISACSSTINNHYIEDKYCKTKCENKNLYENKLEGGLIECVENCGDKYYYHPDEQNVYLKYKCYDKCLDNDYIIEGTNICVTNCGFKNYYEYLFDSKDINPVYKNNTCVKVCPSDKPYLNDKTCLKKCLPKYKYHEEGQFNCLVECPPNTYKDQENKDEEEYVCKSYCPNENNKFLDNKRKECISHCPPEYPYYVKGIYQCLDKCDSKYHIENDTVCVEECSEGFYLFENNTCLSTCLAENEYFVFPINNTCVEKCPENYNFYESKDGINYCKIKCNNVSDTNGKCLANCEDSDYKSYYYKNMTCIVSCPNY